MQPFAPVFTGVVVRKAEAVQHPNADRLRVCSVNAVNHAPPCGPNARPEYGFLRPSGAELPPEMTANP